jgi:hypothetical protein
LVPIVTENRYRLEERLGLKRVHTALAEAQGIDAISEPTPSSR